MTHLERARLFLTGCAANDVTDEDLVRWLAVEFTRVAEIATHEADDRWATAVSGRCAVCKGSGREVTDSTCSACNGKGFAP